MIVKDMKYDIRTLKYRRLRNELSEVEILAHLASLPDDAAEAERTLTQFVAGSDERSRS